MVYIMFDRLTFEISIHQVIVMKMTASSNLYLHRHPAPSFGKSAPAAQYTYTDEIHSPSGDIWTQTTRTDKKLNESDRKKLEAKLQNEHAQLIRGLNEQVARTKHQMEQMRRQLDDMFNFPMMPFSPTLPDIKPNIPVGKPFDFKFPDVELGQLLTTKSYDFPVYQKTSDKGGKTTVYIYNAKDKSKKPVDTLSYPHPVNITLNSESTNGIYKAKVEIYKRQ